MITGNEPIHPESMAVDPHGNVYKSENYINLSGLTIRQHFAAMAMQGMLTCRNGFSGNEHGEADNLAKCAVIQADALIEALNSNQKQK